MTAQMNSTTQINNNSKAQNAAAQALQSMVPYYEPLITMMITPWVMWSDVVLITLQGTSRFLSQPQEQFSDDVQAARDKIIEHAAFEVMGQGQGHNGGRHQQQQYPRHALRE